MEAKQETDRVSQDRLEQRLDSPYLSTEMFAADLEPEEESPLAEPDCDKKLKNTSVAVVGAGLAGLMAARRLCEKGVAVTVYEARDQVGGRVLSNTNYSKGRVTEEGAELIGSFHTRWLALAREYGLGVINRMDERLYRLAGLEEQLKLDALLTPSQLKNLENDAKRLVLEKISLAATQINDASRPWDQSTLQSLDKTSVAEALERTFGVKRGSPLWKYMQFLLVNNEVAPLDQANFLGLLCKVKGGQLFHSMGYWDELEIFRSADGCQELGRRIANEIQKKYRAKLHLSRAVTNITISKAGVVLGSKQVESQRDGKLSEDPPLFLPYDYVVLAIPPSVWSGVAIGPDHPKSSIGIMGMGPAVKYFSNVKKRFWIENKAAPLGGALDLGQVWEGTDNQTQSGGQGIVLSVFAGPVRAGKFGPRAPTADEFHDGLKQLYSGYSANLIKPALFRDWPNTPFIKTGYASPAKGEIFTIAKQLVEPFLDRLFFAGEHTHMEFFGYMEGALRSGERAAENLMKQACGQLKKPRNETFVASAALAGKKTVAELEPEEALDEAPEPEEVEFEYDVAPLESARRDYSLRKIADSIHLPGEILTSILRDGESKVFDLADRAFRMQHPEMKGQTLEKTGSRHQALREEYGAIAEDVRSIIWLRQIIDELDKRRGDIPREFLLAWMAAESDGWVAAPSSRGERGYFQIDWKAGEAREQLGMTDAQFRRLSTDRKFSIEKGVALVEKYRQWVLGNHAGVPDRSDLLWRLTKGRHAASGALRDVLDSLEQRKVDITWDEVSKNVPAFLRNNVNTTLDYAGKLKPFADLVGSVSPAAPQPEVDEADAALEEESELPRGVPEFTHFFQPMKPLKDGTAWTPDGDEIKLQPVNPGFIDDKDGLVASPLQDTLAKLLTGNVDFSKFLTKDSIRLGKAQRDDKIRVALVDLTADKMTRPQFAGWGSTVAVDSGSAVKAAILYAAFQLKSDMEHVANAEGIKKTTDLLETVTKRWRKAGITGGPKLDEVFKTVQDPPRLAFADDVQDAVEHSVFHEANASASLLIEKIGFPYIASLLAQSGLRHPARGGLWILSNFDDNKPRFWQGGPRPSPRPLFMHTGTALSLATFYTLLGQGRLVNRPTSDEMKLRLVETWYGGTLPGAKISAKVGLLHNLDKCLSWETKNGKRECTEYEVIAAHEADYIEHGKVRYAVALMTVGIPEGIAVLRRLVAAVDDLIVRNNP